RGGRPAGAFRRTRAAPGEIVVFGSSRRGGAFPPARTAGAPRTGGLGKRQCGRHFLRARGAPAGTASQAGQLNSARSWTRSLAATSRRRASPWVAASV